VLIPELNLGQLRTIIRDKYLIDAIGLNKVQGKPFSVAEVEAKIEEIITGRTTETAPKSLARLTKASLAGVADGGG
jgi:2-oxoglutarate ferredoxin oxidoreductase subunit alpha